MILVRKDQNRNIFWLVPALIAFHAGAAWFCFEANVHWPDWTLIAPILQFFCFLAYMVYLLRLMSRLFVLMHPEGTK
jgi:hypothetical protein